MKTAQNRFHIKKGMGPYLPGTSGMQVDHTDTNRGGLPDREQGWSGH
jgi:hypothetical protein